MSRAFELEVTESYVEQLDVAIYSFRDRQRSIAEYISTIIIWIQLFGWFLLLAFCLSALVAPLCVVKFKSILKEKRNQENEAHETVSAKTVGGTSATGRRDAPLTTKLVRKFGGCKVIIWSDEHPPPHFHIKFQDEEASFSILTCDRLPGTTGPKKIREAGSRLVEGQQVESHPDLERDSPGRLSRRPYHHLIGASRQKPTMFYSDPCGLPTA